MRYLYNGFFFAKISLQLSCNLYNWELAFVRRINSRLCRFVVQFIYEHQVLFEDSSLSNRRLCD